MAAPSPASMAVLVRFLHEEGFTAEAVALRRLDVRSLEAFAGAGDSLLVSAGFDVGVLPRLRAAAMDGSRRQTPDAPPGTCSTQAQSGSPSASERLVPAERAARPPLRSDHPVLQYTVRGSRTAVATALATEGGRRRALAAVDRDVYAASSRAPRDSLWSTWVFIATSWGEAPLPVTPAVIRLVAAGLKSGGYRSCEQYFSRARQEHLRVLGVPVDAAAEQAFRDFGRSVERGAGPSELKDGFRLEDLAPFVAIPSAEGAASAAEGCCLAPWALTVLGTWWVCRGIELSAAEAADVELDQDKRTVSWSLPVSKRDPQARGESRQHGCCCATPALAPLCPFHLMAAYLQLLQTVFGASFRLPARRMPLFPSAAGMVLTKAATVEAVRSCIAQAGEPLTRVDGMGVARQRFGEHALRVSGAQALARGGMELYLIQLFARWGSSAVGRYVQQAPLAHQAGVAGKVASALSLLAVSQAVDEVRSQVSEQGLLTTALQERLALPTLPSAAALEQLSARLALLERRAGPLASPTSAVPETVLNLDSRCLHRVLTDTAVCQPAHWVTYCGWAFGVRPHRRASAAVDAASRCERCFPEFRRARALAGPALADVGSSSEDDYQ